MIKLNLTGKRFGRLLVLGDNEKRKRGNVLWECLCDCGNKKITYGFSLRNGVTKSCGCLAKELTIKRQTTHGMSHNSVYAVWRGMKVRCENISNKAYHWYGERGIKICNRWHSFNNFWEDMKDGYKKGLTLDRIDNNKGYFKENCRWVTSKINQNNRRDNRIFTYQGKTQNMKQWAEELRINYNTLNTHIQKNWSFEKALKFGVGQQAPMM